jgi:putative DNA primase/helicase
MSNASRVRSQVASPHANGDGRYQIPEFVEDNWRFACPDGMIAGAVAQCTDVGLRTEVWPKARAKLDAKGLSIIVVTPGDAKSLKRAKRVVGQYRKGGAKVVREWCLLGLGIEYPDFASWSGAFRLGDLLWLDKPWFAKGPDPAADDEDLDPAGEINEAPDDPHRLARIFVEAQFRHGELRTLVYHRGECSRWVNAAYRPIPEHELVARVAAAVRLEFEQVNQVAIARWEKRGPLDEATPKPTIKKVTRPTVGNTIQALRGMTLVDGRVEVPAWLIDKPPFDARDVLPCRNALVHLPSFADGSPNAIVTPTPAYFCPYSLDYDFVADAPPTPEFDRFLHSVWPEDPQSIETLLEFIGYLLTPDTRHHKILLLVGPKRSGRGTIGRLIRALIGSENVAAPTLEGMAGNFGLAPLIGKPVAIVGDARVSPRSPHLAGIVERLLGISGEDTWTIDRKHLPAWTGRLPTRLVIVSNELPRLPDQAGALASRYLVLRFTESFIGREDKQLDAKLLAELPGILLRAIAGWQRLRDRGFFIQPESGQADCNQLLDISSPVGAYVRERIVVELAASEDVKAVFDDWCSWCEPKRRESGDEGTFGRNLRTVVPTLITKQKRVGKTRIRVFEGLRLRTPVDDDRESSSPDGEVSRGVTRVSPIARESLAQKQIFDERVEPAIEKSRVTPRDTTVFNEDQNEQPF